MNQNRFHNGFTLVEISIVMIIIGLLIGGIFGGMKLIDNANIQKTIQDIKAIESATLTFRDTYRALPGDIRSPSTRIPNCTVAPCATAGNGDRGYDNPNDFATALTPTMERFTFWHHLQAAELLQMNYFNTTSMLFGEGQPEGALSGYRLSSINGIFGFVQFNGAFLIINDMPSALVNGGGGMTWAVPCSLLQQVDTKMDDGIAYGGVFAGWACVMPAAPAVPYTTSLPGAGVYDLKGF